MRMPPKSPQHVTVWQSVLKDGHDRMIQLLGAATRQGPIQDFVRYANDNYLHWDKLRYHPLPDDLTKDEAWLLVENSRNRTHLPISFYSIAEQLQLFVPPQHTEWLHMIDQNAGGTLGGRILPDDNERYLVNSLMEEAIASSQLEGASTTRKIAKEMLRSKRPPRDKSEQMILNNFNAIIEMRDHLLQSPLTPELLCHLQEILVEKAADHPGIEGRFRTADERIEVVDAMGEIMHTPPPAQQLPERIKELCEFANEKSKPFIHPAIKAIILHFALGFIHPFVDGNGRTARAVFYWYMLKHGFWLFEYLPISRIFLAGPSKYVMAYLYTETDRGDVTYFVHYNLRVILRAIKELHEYLETSSRELREANVLLHQFDGLNHRQSTVIADALKHPTRSFDFTSHASTFRVTYATARTDLLELSSLGFLRKVKSGKRFVFFADNHDMMKKLRKSGKIKKIVPTIDAAQLPPASAKTKLITSETVTPAQPPSGVYASFVGLVHESGEVDRERPDDQDEGIIA
jgi:Fic family protein